MQNAFTDLSTEDAAEEGPPAAPDGPPTPQIDASEDAGVGSRAADIALDGNGLYANLGRENHGAAILYTLEEKSTPRSASSSETEANHEKNKSLGKLRKLGERAKDFAYSFAGRMDVIGRRQNAKRQEKLTNFGENMAEMREASKDLLDIDTDGNKISTVFQIGSRQDTVVLQGEDPASPPRIDKYLTVDTGGSMTIWEQRDDADAEAQVLASLAEYGGGLNVTGRNGATLTELSDRTKGLEQISEAMKAAEFINQGKQQAAESEESVAA